MKADRISAAMNYIDDDLIASADEVRKTAAPSTGIGLKGKSRKVSRLPIIGFCAAAAAVILIGGFIFALFFRGSSVYKSDGMAVQDRDIGMNNEISLETNAADETARPASEYPESEMQNEQVTGGSDEPSVSLEGVMYINNLEVRTNSESDEFAGYLRSLFARADGTDVTAGTDEVIIKPAEEALSVRIGPTDIFIYADRVIFMQEGEVIAAVTVSRSEYDDILRMVNELQTIIE